MSSKPQGIIALGMLDWNRALHRIVDYPAEWKVVGFWYDWQRDAIYFRVEGEGLPEVGEGDAAPFLTMKQDGWGHPSVVPWGES